MGGEHGVLLLSEPLVSVVTPSLDQARFLGEAIESVRTQDYPHVEHIVVDGGSADGSLDLLRAQSGIRWLSESDRGQSDALNKGFALARGAIFGWLNADDVYLPGAIAAAVAAFDDPSIGLVYGGWRKLDDVGDLSLQIVHRDLAFVAIAFAEHVALAIAGQVQDRLAHRLGGNGA